VPERSAVKGSRTGMMASLIDGVRSRLWPLPTVGVLASVALGLLMVRLDGWLDERLPAFAQVLVFGGDAGAARAVLDAVAGSLITVTSLTFSLTVVTLQLASSQFSPRLLRTFAGDGVVQSTLTLFLATFVFALVVLRSVRGSDSEGGAAFIPRLSVNFAVVLAIASVLALVAFLAHLVREIRVEQMLASAHREANATVRRELADLAEADPDGGLVPPKGARPVPSRGSGFLVAVNQSHLLEVAQKTGTVLWLDQPPGATVVAGTPVAFAWSLDTEDAVSDDDLDDLADRVGGGVTLAFERSGTTDVSFGLRQVTDVAVKALSPGTNDPTTASHALGHSASILAEIVGRDTSPVVLRDKEDRIRVVLARTAFADLLALAVDQPRRYGAAEPAILSRILLLIRDVAWRTGQADRLGVLGRQLDRTADTIAAQDFDDDTRAALDDQVTEAQAAIGGDWRPRRMLG
jgi:uncharacterized membrane protein